MVLNLVAKVCYHQKNEFLGLPFMPSKGIIHWRWLPYLNYKQCYTIAINHALIYILNTNQSSDLQEMTKFVMLLVHSVKVCYLKKKNLCLNKETMLINILLSAFACLWEDIEAVPSSLCHHWNKTFLRQIQSTQIRQFQQILLRYSKWSEKKKICFQ